MKALASAAVEKLATSMSSCGPTAASRVKARFTRPVLEPACCSRAERLGPLHGPPVGSASSVAGSGVGASFQPGGRSAVVIRASTRPSAAGVAAGTPDVEDVLPDEAFAALPELPP